MKTIKEFEKSLTVGNGDMLYWTLNVHVKICPREGRYDVYMNRQRMSSYDDYQTALEKACICYNASVLTVIKGAEE